MKTPKQRELEAARELRLAKKKFLDLLFDPTKIGKELAPINKRVLCTECVKTPVDEDADKCGKCGRSQAARCKHFESAKTKIFAFDLCSGLPSRRREDADAERPYGRPPNDKTNMDVFTAQEHAVRRAEALYERLCDPKVRKEEKKFFDLVKSLAKKHDLIDYDPDYSENKYIQLTIIGASVTGLTFHATLVQLMNRRESKSSRFDNVFRIFFVDRHERPLERLRQARDRTIVPRYEYERLYTTDIEFSDENVGKQRAVQAPKYLSKKAAEIHWKDLHGSMPSALRWQPGSARQVSDQIADGYERWIKTKFPNRSRINPTPRFNTVMYHLGSLFVGIASTDAGGANAVDPDADDDIAEELELRLFGLRLANYPKRIYEDPKRMKDPQNRPELYGDILFCAMGLGIDVPSDSMKKLEKRDIHVCNCRKIKKADGSIELKPRRDVYDFPSVSRSYWDTVKPELDVLEAEDLFVAVMGNSDAAAGSIFSIILSEPDYCTFLTLAKMLWLSGPDGEMTELQRWFKALKEKVDRLFPPATTNMNVSRRWINALRHPDIHRHLFQDNDDLSAELVDFTRSGRTVYLGVPWEQEDEDAFNEILKIEDDENADFNATDRFWADKILERAWPENRILGALLKRRITMLLIDYDVGPSLKIKRHRKRQKQTYRIKGPVNELAFGTNMQPWEDYSDTHVLDLKYLINCGGPQYFQRRGNLLRKKRKAG